MLRPRKVSFTPILLVSILVLVCLIAAQYIPKHSRSAHQAQPQNEPGTLREVSMTSPSPAKVQDSIRLQVEASYGNLPLAFEANRGRLMRK